MTLYNKLKYVYDRKISSGAFGSIIECTIDNQTYACKKIKSYSFSEILYDYISEVACLALLTNLNISNVPNIKSFDIDIGTDSYAIKLYMDKFDMDLCGYADKTFTETRIKQFNFIYENLMKALSSLHGLGIVHSDIKNANILINDTNLQITKLCLADYSISSSSPRNIAYTVGYRAPFLSREMSGKKRPVECEMPSFRSDLYACGMVFLSYFNDITFYSTPSDAEITFLKRCLSNNPDILDIVDRLLKYDITLPHYNPVKCTINLRKSPIRIDVKSKIEEIGKEFNCSTEDISMAIDIASRYIEKKQYTESRVINEKLYYGSIMLSVAWGSNIVLSILEDMESKVDLNDDLTKYVLNIIKVIDGLIYNPVIVI